MNKHEDCRYIGIIADGGTDRDILLHLVTCIFNTNNLPKDNYSFTKLQRQKIRDHIEEFWNDASRSNDYSLSSNHSKKLVNRIVQTLYGAFQEFQSFMGRHISSKDMIILNTDAERKLASADRYFDEWAAILPKLVIYGMERFYHYLAIQGYNFEYVPLITPLLLFPSTDILIKAAKSADGSNFAGYAKSPSQLKKELYGTTDLRRVTPDQFKIKALKFLTKEGLGSIYRHLPEIRFFLHIIASLK